MEYGSLIKEFVLLEHMDPNRKRNTRPKRHGNSRTTPIDLRRRSNYKKMTSASSGIAKPSVGRRGGVVGVGWLGWEEGRGQSNVWEVELRHLRACELLGNMRGDRDGRGGYAPVLSKRHGLIWGDGGWGAMARRIQ